MSDPDRDPLHERILEAEARYGLLGEARRVLVGVSGGQDSVALLHSLVTMPEIAAETAAIHVHHGMRGAEADADQAAVEALCDRLGVRCFVASRNVPTESAKSGLNPELAGRRARYEEYVRIADEHGFDRIATGHTGTDRAETLLLNLLRGAGLRGMASIPPRRGRIVRPLIRATRLETGEYCRRHSLPACTDRTNLDVEHARRNALRLRVMPLVEELFPEAEVALMRACETIEEELAWTEPLVARELDDATAETGDRRVELSVGRLRELEPGLANRVIRAALERARGDLEGLSREHIERVAALLEAHTGGTVELPGGSSARREYDRLVLEDAAVAPETPTDEEAVLPVPGEATLFARGLTVRAEPGIAPDELDTGDPLAQWVDAGAADGGLVLRGARTGDRLVPLGMTGSKKLQDLFVDNKVPRWIRGRAAVVTDGGGRILWVVGHRLAETARACSGQPAVRLIARDADSGTEEDV